MLHHRPRAAASRPAADRECFIDLRPVAVNTARVIGIVLLSSRLAIACVVQRCRLPDRGRICSAACKELTYSRDHRGSQLTVILAGQVSPLRDLRRTNPGLAARFPLVIDVPLDLASASLRARRREPELRLGGALGDLF